MKSLHRRRCSESESNQIEACSVRCDIHSWSEQHRSAVAAADADYLCSLLVALLRTAERVDRAEHAEQSGRADRRHQIGPLGRPAPHQATRAFAEDGRSETLDVRA